MALPLFQAIDYLITTQLSIESGSLSGSKELFEKCRSLVSTIEDHIKITKPFSVSNETLESIETSLLPYLFAPYLAAYFNLEDPSIEHRLHHLNSAALSIYRFVNLLRVIGGNTLISSDDYDSFKAFQQKEILGRMPQNQNMSVDVDTTLSALIENDEDEDAPRSVKLKKKRAKIETPNKSSVQKLLQNAPKPDPILTMTENRMQSVARAQLERSLRDQLYGLFEKKAKLLRYDLKELFKLIPTQQKAQVYIQQIKTANSQPEKYKTVLSGTGPIQSSHSQQSTTFLVTRASPSSVPSSSNSNKSDSNSSPPAIDQDSYDSSNLDQYALFRNSVDEEFERELLITGLKHAAVSAIIKLKHIPLEQEMVRYRHRLETDIVEQKKYNAYKLEQNNISATEKQKGLDMYFIGSDLKPTPVKRQDIRQKVFESHISKPTRTLDQQADIEMQQLIDNENRSSMYKQLEIDEKALWDDSEAVLSHHDAFDARQLAEKAVRKNIQNQKSRDAETTRVRREKDTQISGTIYEPYRVPQSISLRKNQLESVGGFIEDEDHQSDTDDDTADEKTLHDRYWDDFKDNNPKGIGNMKGKY